MVRALPLLLMPACVLPPVNPTDEALDSAGSVEREPPPPALGCGLTVATICSDCNVTVDWAGVTRSSTGEPFDPSSVDFAAVWIYVETTPPPDLADALCRGDDYDRPDALSYFDDVKGTSVVLGRDLPRVRLQDQVGIFKVGAGFEYVQALLVPDPGSTTNRVVLE